MAHKMIISISEENKLILDKLQIVMQAKDYGEVIARGPTFETVTYACECTKVKQLNQRARLIQQAIDALGDESRFVDPAGVIPRALQILRSKPSDSDLQDVIDMFDASLIHDLYSDLHEAIGFIRKVFYLP